MALVAVLLGACSMGAYHQLKPLPDGLSTAGPLRPAEELVFLGDYTFLDEAGERQTDHAIFDDILRLIGQAEHLVVLDMFLFNDFAGEADAGHRPLAAELTDALVRRKEAVPELEAVVITDPFNTLYGGIEPDHFTALTNGGVEVVITDITQLRDSNPAWSSLWRLCCQWFGNNADAGWLPNPVGPHQVTLRSYLQLLNFNVNHRKTLVVDEGEDWTALVTSANPHDASSAHSNAALRFHGAAALDLLETERAVAAMSGARLPDAPPVPQAQPLDGEAPRLQVLTEAKIRDASLAAIEGAGEGDRLAVAMFYFSHRPLLDAVIRARERGVDARVLLDPNEHAFGRKKNGIPNRQAALDLHGAGVPVRWCDTHGEQCHSKFLLHIEEGGEAELILGSANFTRRNLDDYNLETSVRVLAGSSTPAIREAARFFDQYWHNRPNRKFSVPYSEYADPSLPRYWQYRLMEATGMSTF